jgi:hypothetical protein
MPQGIANMKLKPQVATFEAYLQGGFIPKELDFDQIMEEHEYES